MPIFFIALYLETIDNISRPITELSVWSLQSFGVDMKKYLMQRFEDPDIAPVEMCMVLAALMALSEIYLLGTYHIGRRGECSMILPYRRPPISELYEWIQRPSELHHGWDVIETLMCSYEAVFGPPENDSAMYRLFNVLEPVIEVSQVPESYFFYWRQRRLRMMDAEQAMGLLDLKVDSEKDLTEATNDEWHTRGQDAFHSLVDFEPTGPMEHFQEEPPPIYTPCSLSDPENSECNLVRQNRNTTKRPWQRRIIRALPFTSDS